MCGHCVSPPHDGPDLGLYVITSQAGWLRTRQVHAMHHALRLHSQRVCGVNCVDKDGLGRGSIGEVGVSERRVVFGDSCRPLDAANIPAEGTALAS